MHPKQFDAWLLEDRREPWEITLRHFSQAVALIYNALLKGPVSELKESDLLPLDFMLPKPEEEADKPVMPASERERRRIGV